MAAVRIVWGKDIDPRIRLYWLLIICIASNFIALPVLIVLVPLLFSISLIRFRPIPRFWLLWTLIFGVYFSLGSLISGSELLQVLNQLLLFYARSLIILIWFIPFSCQDLTFSFAWFLRPLPKRIQQWGLIWLIEFCYFLAVLGTRLHNHRIRVSLRGIRFFQQPVLWLDVMCTGVMAGLCTDCARRSKSLANHHLNQIETSAWVFGRAFYSGKSFIWQFMVSILATLALLTVAVLFARQ